MKVGQIQQKLLENNLQTIRVRKKKFNEQWKVKQYFPSELKCL